MAKPPSRTPARKATARPAPVRTRAASKPHPAVGRRKAGGPVVSRASAPSRPAKPGPPSPGRGKPPDDVVGRGPANPAMPRRPEKASSRTPKAVPPSAGARGRRPLFARTPNEEGPSPAVPSSLNMNRRPSAARSGRAELAQKYRQHRETDPGMTGGDIDADWESAYSVGDEAPGGDNPTPGQTVVEDVGRALGVEYEDGEELKGADKIENRDRRRWELDPASSEDYKERTKGGERRKGKR